MNNIITIRGERELWLDFVHKVKKDKKKIWNVLRPYLKKYSMCDEENRVLLLLFPRELVDDLVKKEDPDRFIEEAVQKHLAKEK
jgi:hypothetical protein